MSVEVVNIASPFPLASIPLDEVSKILSPMTVSSALVFNGRIDLLRFQTALRDLITYCPWLACAYHEFGGDRISAEPNLSGDSAHGSFVCEVDSSYDEQEFYIADHCASVKIADLLPAEVHIKMVRPDLALQSVQDLPISAFRITTFRSHFVIGYRLNHAFYDQCAIVELFSFLGDIYHHNGEPTGVPPRFLSRANLSSEETFSSEEDFNRAAPAGYSTDSSSELSFGAPKTVRLLFNSDKISELRSSAHIEFTSNDVMNAVLLKAVAQCNYGEEGFERDETSEARVLFARNMRRQLDLGHEIVGDYVRLESLQSSFAEISNSTILDIALKNHALVGREDAKENFVRETAWFKEFSRFHSGRPNSNFLNDRRAVLISNWSSFPYEHIHFDVSTVEELLVEDVAMMSSCAGFVHITFHGQGKHRQLIAILSTQHQAFIDSLVRIGDESQLFHLSK
eukprot:CAMPEP_0202964912 /NCGR_PEP_ID=MMETSP1396-20130829/9036_1 /ASSEMBLY_ACC=CAM_ASM_000872 /TAXON_ID= /ORGANISM="Pseudokeronopsis sp., Strain Brazil" /LENGTH=453 /DNA_ID=CAMNT_0049687431 /DNA_START=44 /DNA_END=1405 /DNA_ORIENTATION=-